MHFIFPRTLVFVCLVFTLLNNTAIGQSIPQYDIVLTGGRVMDPETKLDAIRNIGIRNNRIAAISSEPLQGKEIINASGLVVAPGFIDMHVHGRSNIEQEYQLHDGLTTALELEWGIEFLDKWYETRKSKALINYGASVCWPFERFRSMTRYRTGVDELYQKMLRGESSLESLGNILTPSYTDTITVEEMNRTLSNIKTSLEQGGVGIGLPIGYLPKTRPEEFYRIFQLAGEMNVLVFSHVRAPDIISIQEAIVNAMLTKAPLHIVHINSMALGHIQMALDLIQSAKSKGFDISTELYPYTAASTMLQSAIFSDGWQERLGIQYNDLQWVATGERLTKESFTSYRKEGGTTIIHMMKPDWINMGIRSPGVMIASDGMPYAPLAHPRTAGTFSRVLSKYVRDDKVVDLMTALAKMTLLPAQRLETVAPMMRLKGRIQVGADADITVFNPATITDKASFEKGLAFSQGVEYVIVNGTIVLKNGKTVASVFPGQPIYGKFKK